MQELVFARTGSELSETEATKITNNFYTDGSQFSSNFINGRPIANLRLEYEQASRDIQSQTAKMLASGASDEQVARWAVEQRNQLKLTYRDLTPASMLTAIEARNIERYGNALGPTIDQLRSKGKTWNDIITGAAKPGGLDLDFAPPGFFTGPK